MKKQGIQAIQTYEQLEALYEVTHAVTAHLQLDVVLDTIARSTAELLGTDTGVILLLDEPGEFLSIASAYGLSEPVVRGTHDRLGESLAGRVVQSGKPIIANDLPNDSRFYNPSAANEGLLACASVPLRIGDKIIGTLDVHSKRNRWAFDASHIQILEMLASQAAIAIEHARLYERLQKAHDELETRVQERTAELVAANERLQYEMSERSKIDEKLRRERNLLRTLIDHLPEYVFVKDAQCRFLLVNNLSLLPNKFATENEWIGKTDFDLFPPELAQQYYDDEQEILRKGQGVVNQEEPSLDLETGAKRWRITSKIPFRDAQGKTAGLVGISRDVTEQKQAKEALQRRNRELSALNHMNEILQTCRTEEETYKLVASVSEQLFPHDSGCIYMLDASQNRMTQVACWGTPLEHPNTVKVEDCRNLQPQPITTRTPEIVPQCPCWDSSPESSCVCAPIRTPEEIIGVFHLCLARQEAGYTDDQWEDLLESKRILATRISGQYALFLVNLRLRETLRIEAIRDPLTNLYNRRHMEAALEREAFRTARYNSHLGIIMLDIDHFKEVNDMYGHEAGDMVLQTLGQFLLSNTRGEDIACRYGGEEFLLIMSETSLCMTQRRAQELWSKIRGLHLEYQGIPLPLTISIGVASLPDHGSTVKDVLKAADTALYQAKAEGRDRVVVAPVPSLIKQKMFSANSV